MALKFLNKKGWHTGSLRNIENVWKAEQKHDAEQKKLEELRKQIQEERERSEFRQLQEQAGLVPRQERLEFLYDSGLAVGKGSSSGSGFKALDSPSQKTDSGTAAPSSCASASKQQSSAPGALFEEKSQSANDAWRKLHSDPLLLIRQREQEALARVKNNPIQMAMIRKSIEGTKNKGKTHDKDEDKEPRIKHHCRKKYEKHSSSKSHSNLGKTASKGKERRKSSHHKGSCSASESSDAESSDGDAERRRSSYKDHNYNERSSALMDPETGKDGKWRKRANHDDFRREEHYSRQKESPSIYKDNESVDDLETGKDGKLRKKVNHNDFRREEHYSRQKESPSIYKDKESVDTRVLKRSQFDSSDMMAERSGPLNKRRNPAKLSNEERAAKLREMQMDAELHEEQRWKRLKKAEEKDAQEAVHAHQSSRGRSFLDAVQKSVYGTDKGSSTIEESVRRRTHYLQGKSESTDRNAFRR